MGSRRDLDCAIATADCRLPLLTKGQAAGLSGVARGYIKKGRPKAQRELGWFKEQPSLRFAIELAAFALNSSGKRYGHQTRLKRSALIRAEELLVANEGRIAECRSFEALLSLIEALLLPREWRSLPAHEIEDILCTFKDRF